MRTITTAVLASAACAALLAGCATNPQGQLVFDPNQLNAVLAPQPPVVEEVYQPMPTDVYVADVAERDVIVYRGDTYIWVTGPNGVRHRQFYAHGDHRADVFHRREELHHVMVNHGGRLPDHPVGGEHRPGFDHAPGMHPQPGRPGEPVGAFAAHGQPTPAPHPGAAPMPAAHVAAPAHPAPAPAQKPSKDQKKS